MSQERRSSVSDAAYRGIADGVINNGIARLLNEQG